MNPSSAIVSTPGDGVRASRAEFASDWRVALKSAVRDPAVLLRRLCLPEDWLPPAREAAAGFGLFAPREYIAKMRVGDPHDPLLRQVWPAGDELAELPGFSTDPVGDLAARRAPGLLHKYAGRALLVTTGACAVHCRYCFRRHFPYEETPRGLTQWRPALDAIDQDPSLSEIILSGGDPLTLVDESLAQLADALAAIPHVRRLRVHTRLPIMIPQRVTNEMLQWLGGTRLAPIVVVHANHAHELADDVAAALGRLTEAGALVLNQAVLLRGVNDSAAALRDLCLRLLDLRVTPYYLHQLDRVRGAAHFETPLEDGLRIMEELRASLPGYALPRYVRETAGGRSKEPLSQ